MRLRGFRPPTSSGPPRAILLQRADLARLLQEKSAIANHVMKALGKGTSKWLPIENIEIIVDAIAAMYSECGVLRQPPHLDWRREAIWNAYQALLGNKRLKQN